MNCKDCYYSKSIPGDTHISCSHPEVDFSNIPETLNKFNINSHGIKMGWASWPFSFDGVWLSTTCNKFQRRK